MAPASIAEAPPPEEPFVENGTDDKVGCFSWIGYDPYSGCLTDHYQLGQILGRGAYGEVRSAKLRPKSQLFSRMCVRCYFSKQKVDAIVSAPDLDDIIESFRGKRDGKRDAAPGKASERLESAQPGRSSSADNALTMFPQAASTTASRALGIIRKIKSSNKETQVIPDETLDDRVKARLSTGRLSRSFALGASPSILKNNQSFGGNQSFVTSESFIKRVCSYDESKLRERPSPNDALRRMMTKPHLTEKANFFEMLQPVHAWSFAVKCMKKAALVQEETSLLCMIDQRISTIQSILDGTATDEVLKQLNNSASIAAISSALSVPGESTKRKRSTFGMQKRMSFVKSRSPSVASIPIQIPILPTLKQGRNSTLLRHPMLLTAVHKSEQDDPLSLDFYDGNKELYKTALQIEVKELCKRKKEVAKDLRSVPESAVLKELKLLALCRHKNILYLVEAFEDERWMYVVVERCYGDFTSRYGKRAAQPFPSLDTVCRVTFQVLLAVQHMHRLFVIHRDIKPENILFKNPEHPMFPPDIVLGDFGMAVQLQHRGSVCTDLAGSAAFMSPETWSKCYQNFKCDVWAVGVCMYEMIYCALPFHATSHPDVPVRHVRINEFCDLAYKLGTVGIRLAQVVCDESALPIYSGSRTAFSHVGSSTLEAHAIQSESARETVTGECFRAVKEMLEKRTEIRKSATQVLALPWFRVHLDKEEIKKGQTGSEKK